MILIYILALLWGIVSFGMVFKAVKFLEYAAEVIDVNELRIKKKNLRVIEFLLLLLTFVSAIYYSIYGLDLIFYVLLMGTFFLVFIRLHLFFSRPGFIFFIILVLISGFLGNFTGKIAFDVNSPLLLETLFFGIFIIPLYVVYCLKFNEKNKKRIVNGYISYFNKLKINSNYKEDLNYTIKLVNRLKDAKKEHEEAKRYFIPIRKEPMRITSTIGITENFLNMDFNKLELKDRIRGSINKFSEFLSIISSGGIGADYLESMIKAGWYLKLQLSEEKDINEKIYNLEITKAQQELLSMLAMKEFLIFAYKYWSSDNRQGIRTKYDTFLITLEEELKVLERRSKISRGIPLSLYKKQLEKYKKLGASLFKEDEIKKE